MSAQGKITAAAIAQAPAGTVRVLITDDPQLRKPPSERAGRNSIWYPAANKRGMAVATVTDVRLAVQQRGATKRRYDLITDRGTVENVSGSQTFWLAPDAGTERTRMMGAPEAVQPHQADVVADRFLAAVEAVGYPLWLSHVRDGDVITLPGETERRTVASAWWISERQAHGLRFDDGTAREVASEGAPRVRLHERPGFGPFDERYEVGDRVVIWTPTREALGVVLEVTRYGDGIDEVAYEVGTVSGGKVAVGSENMRREYTPAPQVGEVWTSVTGTQIVIESLDTHGLVGYGSGLVSGGGIQYGAPRIAPPHWMPPTTQHKAPSALMSGDVVAGLVTPDGTIRELFGEGYPSRYKVLRSAGARNGGWWRLVFADGFEVEYRDCERFAVVAELGWWRPLREPAAPLTTPTHEPFVSGWAAVGASA